MTKQQKELEDIFLDEIIWRVGSIKKGNIKPGYNYTELKQNAITTDVYSKYSVM
jgi:hypothetical protein